MKPDNFPREVPLVGRSLRHEGLCHLALPLDPVWARRRWTEDQATRAVRLECELEEAQKKVVQLKKLVDDLKRSNPQDVFTSFAGKARRAQKKLKRFVRKVTDALIDVDKYQ